MLRGAYLFLLLSALFLVALGLFLYRPSPLLGVDDRTLAYSVALKAGSNGRCARGSEEPWRCRATYGSTGEARYSVRVRSPGCWNAKRVGADDGGSGAKAQPKRIEGCINILDHVRLFG